MCKKCPRGFITALPGRKKCKKCPAGKTSNPSNTRCMVIKKKGKCAKKGWLCESKTCCKGLHCDKVGGRYKCV